MYFTFRLPRTAGAGEGEVTCVRCNGGAVELQVITELRRLASGSEPDWGWRVAGPGGNRKGTRGEQGFAGTSAGSSEVCAPAPETEV